MAAYFDHRLEEELKKLEEAAMPVKAPPTAPPKPRPSAPRPHIDPGPEPTPWSPPRPKIDPTPKNVQKASLWNPRRPKISVPDKPLGVVPNESILDVIAILCEAYETEVHPSTQQFWRGLRGSGHRLARHPILAAFGDELSRESWAHTKEKARNARVDLNQTMRIFMEITRREAEHVDELIDLAKRVTVHIWGCPEDILSGKLTQEVEHGEPEEPDEEPDEKSDEERANLDKEVDKRVTINAMAHGSAVHAMMTMHHAVDKEIAAIDPELLQLYNKISAASHQQYWMIDIPAMFEMLGMAAAGSTKIKYDEEDQPYVDARAVCFPVLAQEMSKGVAELLSHHGLQNLDEPATKHVLNRADDVRHEPYLIQVGPEIWRKLLAVKPRDVSIAQLYQALAMQEPDRLHEIIYRVLKEPDEAGELLASLVAQPEQPEEEWSEEEPDWSGGSEEWKPEEEEDEWGRR